MLIFGKIGSILLLFALIYISVKSLLSMLVRQRKARYRLLYVKQSKLTVKMQEYLLRKPGIYAYLNEMIESVESPFSLQQVVTITCLLLLGGIVAGALFFQSVKGVLVVAVILASLPVMLLRMRLISIRMRTRLEFLPAVEVFYQYYMVSPNKNVRSALKSCLEEGRMLYPIKPVFEQLYRNIMTHRDLDESLRIFALTLGHTWADYFVGVLKVALQEGVTWVKA
ncbi:hypothetical protein [Paenibacillus hexagrammi]|uniref:Uncharacterized protein n=1 Tax=Paenibacillus hexagrammi TaxID=2908839 RepID=A0ABY3SF63_9BACL|nr:hypothetical protein [Paenibacillus sp. YPD9-1]UJF32546.1 hypothetical protein L0M14_23275 [Paenibacillus sp. YPD9-1]